MKKRFVTITAGNHPDWTAEDWKNVWAGILKKIDVNLDAENNELLFSKDMHFVDWNMWMGIDPAVDSVPVVILKEKNGHIIGDINCPCCKKERLIEKKLRSFGVSDENYIVRDGKVFMNNPMLDSMLGD